MNAEKEESGTICILTITFESKFLQIHEQCHPQRLIFKRSVMVF